MKKTILLGISALVASSLLCACSEEWGVNKAGAGRISPEVGIDTQAVTSRSDAASRADGDITAADLSLTLTKADGSYKQTWETVPEFPVDKEFSVGDYTLDAFYGDPEEQGFEKPAYAGSQTLKVSDGLTTTLGLTASLANSMFTIKYTDAFVGYMADWSASVAGIEYAKDETRPVYVKPGDVTIKINVTKPNGLKAEFTLDKVTAEPKYHYMVTVDVNDGNVGGSALKVTFDDNLAKEEVEIDHSDKLLSAPVPVVTADGFTAGTPVSFVAGLSSAQHLAMSVIAQAGLAEVLLETSSVSLLAQGWPASIDLLKATSAEQATLTGLGLSALGLWKSPDQMAVIDFSDVVKNIRTVDSDNNSVFTLTVKDKLSRVCEPLALTLTVEEIMLELETAGQFFAPGEDLEVKVGFNGGNVADNVKIEYYHPVSAMWRPVAIKSVSEGVSRSMTDYTVTIVAPDVDGDLRLRAKCGDKVSATLTVGSAPFELAGNDNDIYATHAYVTVIGTEGNPTPNLDGAEFYVKRPGEDDYALAEAVRTGDYFDVKGLAAGAENLVKVRIDGMYCKARTIVTEEAAQLPNSGMEEWTSTTKKGSRVEWFVGGDVWGTLNPLTISQWNATGSAAYVATSGTLSTTDSHTGNAAMIRTVGWGSGNTNAGSWSVIKHVDRGELFLGKWGADINDGTLPEYGISFASRPSALKFFYKFSKVNNRTGYAEIKVYDAAGNELASNSFGIDEQSTYVEKTLPLTWNRGMAKAAKISLIFRSSNVGKPLDGTAMEKNDVNTGSTHVGSTLYVDDIELIY